MNFDIPFIHVYDDRGAFGRESYVCIIDDAQSPRTPVTVYVHDHPEIMRLHEIAVAAHKGILEIVSRLERDGVELPT